MTSRPRLDRDPMRLPELIAALGAVWDTLGVLARELADTPWTVVGGQMVYLHALEHDTDAPRVSSDIDAAVDVRTDPQGIRKMVSALERLGFQPAGQSPEGHVHRFEKETMAGTAIVDLTVEETEDRGNQYDNGVGEPDAVAVDILAPEGLGPRADLRTVGIGTAFPAKGVSQALDRTELVAVERAGWVTWVPRPDLLGAIVIKAVAVDVDQLDNERHLTDLTFLCGLVKDPFELRSRSNPKDRQRVRAAAAKLPADHSAWNAAADPDDARATLSILAEGSLGCC